MCRYTTINLSSTECARIRTGEIAHVYTKYIYWLCRDARGETPCSNQVPKEDQIGSDVGSRQGRCPTCDKISEAEYEYKVACERATQRFNIEVNSAFQKKEDEVNNSDYIIETYSYSHRPRRRYYS